jgi:hypothetical protein
MCDLCTKIAEEHHHHAALLHELSAPSAERRALAQNDAVAYVVASTEPDLLSSEQKESKRAGRCGQCLRNKCGGVAQLVRAAES